MRRVDTDDAIAAAEVQHLVLRFDLNAPQHRSGAGIEASRRKEIWSRLERQPHPFNLSPEPRHPVVRAQVSDVRKGVESPRLGFDRKETVSAPQSSGLPLGKPSIILGSAEEYRKDPG
jgi:hypothetical protein